MAIEQRTKHESIRIIQKYAKVERVDIELGIETQDHNLFQLVEDFVNQNKSEDVMERMLMCCDYDAAHQAHKLMARLTFAGTPVADPVADQTELDAYLQKYLDNTDAGQWVASPRLSPRDQLIRINHHMMVHTLTTLDILFYFVAAHPFEARLELCATYIVDYWERTEQPHKTILDKWAGYTPPVVAG